MARVRAQLLPLDHELFLLLREPRRLSFEYRDGLWVRLVDVEAALNARSYKPGEPVVIELVDEFCPWNAGRWRVGPDGAERTDAEAELAMPVESLGSAYLGGFSFGELARAGRVEELAEGRSTGRTGSSAPTATRGARKSSEGVRFRMWLEPDWMQAAHIDRYRLRTTSGGSAPARLERAPI